MHGFRERPLIWLFVAALASINLVMILPMLFPARELDDTIPNFLVILSVPGQLCLVALWAALSSSYRLWRGALFTGAVYLAISALWLFGMPRQVTLPYYLIPLLLVWSLGLGLRWRGLLPGWSAPCSQPLRLISISRQELPSTPGQVPAEKSAGPSVARSSFRWQFSVLELLGWTCVTALWAYALRNAVLKIYHLNLLTAMVLVPLLIAFLWGGPGSWWGRFLLVLPAILVIMIFQRGAEVLPYYTDLVQAVFVSCWYLVLRLDGIVGPSQAECS